jgi:hypothetical protein
MEEVTDSIRDKKLCDVVCERYLPFGTTRSRPTKGVTPVTPLTIIAYGAPGMIRTCDPLIRSQVLYPTELRVRLNGRIRI